LNSEQIDFGLPSAEQIEGARAAAISAADELVATVVAVPSGQRTFANTMLPLEDAADLVEKAQGRFGFMSYVAEEESVRTAADGLREALEKYEIELSFREDLFAAVQEYAGSTEAAALTGEDKRLLEWTLRDYRRDGFGLPPEQRAEVKEHKKDRKSVV